MKKTTRFRRVRPSLFQTRGSHTHKKPAIVESADTSGKFGSWREEMEIDSRTGRKRSRMERKTRESEEDERGGDCEWGTEEKQNNEKDEVDRKIEALQRIVPGGDSVGVDKLFEKTAGYILCLQRQVKVLRTLSIVLERLDKEKTKCGC